MTILGYNEELDMPRYIRGYDHSVAYGVSLADLRPGMLTEHGLIIAVGIPPHDDRFFDGCFIRFFDINDCFHGSVYQCVSPDATFKILSRPGEEGYKVILEIMSKHRQESIVMANKDISVINSYLEDATV